MRNEATDTARAVVQAVLVHLGLVALFLASMWWADRTRPTEAAGGMAAEVVDAAQLSAAMQRTLRQAPVEPAPLPQPEPEPDPVPPAPEPAPQPLAQEQLPQPEPVNQDRVVDAPTPVRATETRPQEEKRRQEQVDLTPPVRQREQQTPPTPPRQQVDENRLAEIRRQRAAQSREARLAEERLRQLEELQARRGGSAAAEAARADAGASGGNNDDLRGRYAAALQQAVRAKWKRPGNVDRVPGMCRLEIVQSPGGAVREARAVEPCSYDEAGRRSIESAVLMAQPLPYAGFEPVFEREIVVRFRDSD